MKQVRKLFAVALALVLGLALGMPVFAAGDGSQGNPYEGAADFGSEDGNSIILHKLDIGKFEREKQAALIKDGTLAEGDKVTYAGNIPTGVSLQEGSVVGSYTTTKDPTTKVVVTLGELAALGNVAFRIEQVKLMAGRTPGSIDPADYEPAAGGIDSYAKTSAAGQISWTGLFTGYYRITEEANETGQPVGPASFLVSVPMVDPLDDSKTVNTVHIYPKNRATEAPVVEKEQPGPEDFNGNIVSWTIRSEVPASLKPAKGSQSYTIRDTMSNGLNYAGNLKVYYLSGGSKVELEKDADYEVTAVTGGTSLVITLLDGGFGTLGNAVVGDSIDKDGSGRRILYVEYDTVIGISQEDMQNHITPSNNVELDFTNSEGTDYEDHPDPVVVEHYAGLRLHKRDGANETVLLPNAKFKIYTKLSGEGVDADSVLTGADGAPLEFTTDDMGQFFYGGLGAGDYHLVETEAPEGYKLLNKYTTITISQADVEGDLVKEAVVKNYLDNGFTLPSTGGMGTTIFTVVGIAFIVVACAVLAFLMLRSRKESKQ